MNEENLPPITVNQPSSDQIQDEADPNVPNEIENGNNNAVNTNPTTDTNNLNKLNNNLDEPNMADPLPVQTITEPTVSQVAPQPTPPILTNPITNSSDNKKTLLTSLLVIIIIILAILTTWLFYQNNLLIKQNYQ
ncbi:MAG: hypothetical protein ABFQ62_01510 [Patescibacteria group bacterium]